MDPLLSTRPMDLNLTPKEPLTCRSTTGTWKGRLSSLDLPCSPAGAQADRPIRNESRPESKARSRYDLLPPWSKRNCNLLLLKQLTENPLPKRVHKFFGPGSSTDHHSFSSECSSSLSLVSNIRTSWSLVRPAPSQNSYSPIMVWGDLVNGKTIQNLATKPDSYFLERGSKYQQYRERYRNINIPNRDIKRRRGKEKLKK